MTPEKKRAIFESGLVGFPVTLVRTAENYDGYETLAGGGGAIGIDERLMKSAQQIRR